MSDLKSSIQLAATKKMFLAYHLKAKRVINELLSLPLLRAPHSVKTSELSKCFTKWQCVLRYFLFSDKTLTKIRRLTTSFLKNTMHLSNFSSTGATQPTYPSFASDEPEIIVSAVMYVILGILIIVGNILVIAAFKTNVRLRSINNTFLVGLAVSDLLVGLVSIPLWIYNSTCNHYKT